MDIASQFRAAIAATGLTPPDDLSPGTRIRFPGLNKPPKTKDAWCFLFEDGLGGVFGDHSSGIDSVWQASSGRNFTESERQAFEQKVRATRVERERQQAIDKARAATLAKRRWEEASPCQYAQYLEAKGVRSYGLRQEADGGLLVPITKSDGEIVSLQTVDKNGQKRFLQDGEIRGNYYLIGEPAKQIVVCEGYATGASIHEATGIAVAVSFNAGNLEAVARSIKTRYPEATVILAADDDHAKQLNVGLRKATDAALTVGGLLAIPYFNTDRNSEWTDFNDLHTHEGLEAVKRCFSVVSLTDPSKVWPAPVDIAPHVTSEPYPVHALPLTIRAAVEEVQAFVKSPFALVACSALASLSLACQGHIDVQRAYGLIGPTSLFFIAIAFSGERKTSSDGYMSEPIREYGGTHRITRRTSEPIEIRGVRLTMALQTQEQTLKEFVNKTGGLARDIGFFARFLMTFPESTQGTRLFSEPPSEWPDLSKFQKRIDEILNMPLQMTEENTLTPRLMRLSPQAKQIWVEFHDAIEVELRHDGELCDVRDVASKAADNAARLAALFQMVDSGFSEVSAHAMTSATQIVAWHLHEARRVLPQLALNSKDKNLLLVDQWLIRNCRQEGVNSVAKNDLRQRGPVRSTKDLDLILAELANLNRVRVVQNQRQMVEVNPSLIGDRDGVA